jgi:hypothetical protein
MMVGSVYAQTNTCSTTTGVTTCNYTINDDGYAIVPIPFGFPYYGKLFTHSLFFDNGVVSFYSPTNIDDPMRTGGQNFYAQPLSNNIGSQFYYSIMPLWSDLLNYNGSYYTETDGSGYLKYNWENISQFGYPDRLNTFGLEIRPTGFIGVNYQQINIQGYPITTGTVGNASLGEWTQYNYYDGSQQLGLNIPGWSTESTGAYDPCITDPLSSPSCSGYQQAYHDQQCSINPLYAVTCPGYQSAYYTQQCSINPLYDFGCPGYQQAYFDQQCSADPLYNSECPGYTQAYLNQQCSLDGLYDRSCSNYAEAYAKQNLLSNSSSSTTEIVSTTEPTVQVGDDGKVTTDVPLVSDPVVNNVLTNKKETKKEESKEETKPVASEKKSNSKSQAKREPPKVDPSTQTDSEKEFEKEIASQNQAIAAISAVPGFSAYQNAIIPDTNELLMKRQYEKPIVDNARASRQLNGASDRMHQEMINEQYRTR